jgi:hypothetical protein
MSEMKKLLTCAALLGALATAAASIPAQAQDDDGPSEGGGGVRLGTLSCHEAGGWGLVLGSSHHVRCLFTGNGDHGRPDAYEGEVTKFGVDLGYQSSAVIVWAVVAPTGHVGHGDLAGHYAGGTANAAVIIGAGANALFGGFHRSVALQPVSISGETGLNVAAGIGELTLRPAHDQG